MTTQRRTARRPAGLGTGALLLAAILPMGAAAQDGTDARWLPWLGCWEVEGAAEGGAMLCLLPVSGDVAVEMVTVEESRIVGRERIRADGTTQDSSREGCRGWERASFSEDGRRVYLDGDHLCEGIVEQRSSGLLAMLSPTEWIDVRALEVDGRVSAGVARYRLAPIDVAEAAGLGDIAADRAMAVRAARVSASAELSVEDVIDASRHVNADVVRAWIAERGEPFRLDAGRLGRLADAGVPPEVIDVMVAVSYPRHFVLGDDGRVSEAEPDPDVGSRAVGPRGRDPWGYPRPPRRGGFWDPFYGGYGGYGGYYGGFGYPGFFRPVVVVTRPAEGERGRVVNGRGYTRGDRSSPSTSRGATPRGGDNGGRSSASAPPRSSEGSPAAGSRPADSGRSGGSGGTPTGRTARPRPGPGG